MNICIKKIYLSKILLLFLIISNVTLNKSFADNTEKIKTPSANKCPQGQYIISDNNGDDQKIVCQQSEDVLQDPRCDDQFIKNLFAKNRCIDGNDPSACTYLALAGIGAFAGASISNKFLKNMELNSQTNRSFNQKIQEAITKIESEVSKPENQGNSTTRNKPVAKEIISQLLSEYDSKFASEFSKFYDSYQQTLEEVSEKIQSSLENDSEYKKLKKIIDDNSDGGKFKQKPSTSSFIEDLQLELDEIRTRIANEVYAEAFEKIEKSFPKNSLMAERFRLLLNIIELSNFDTIPFLHNEIGRFKNFLKTKSKWTQRGVKVGVPIGIGLAIGMILPGIEFAIDYKTQKCAKEIGLTNELELKLVLPHLRKLGSASPCQNFQIENNIDFLGELKKQFGFIPKGACELALKKNQYYDKITTDISFTKTNCNKISHKDYSLDLTTKEFRCRGNSGYEYVAKTNDKNYPDWDSLFVYYNGEQRPNLKLNFINNFQIKSSIFATSHDAKPDNIKNSRSRCFGSSDNSDYCKCIRGATIAQIIANSHLGLVCNENVTDYQIDDYQKHNGIK